MTNLVPDKLDVKMDVESWKWDMYHEHNKGKTMQDAQDKFGVHIHTDRCNRDITKVCVKPISERTASNPKSAAINIQNSIEDLVKQMTDSGLQKQKSSFPLEAAASPRPSQPPRFEIHDSMGAGAMGSHLKQVQKSSIISNPTSSVSRFVKFKFKSSGLVVYVYEYDITRLAVDIVVNAANDKLVHAGGVAEAILEAAGPKLDKECSDFIRMKGSLGKGEVFATSAGNMPPKQVYHVVGPRKEDDKLINKYSKEITFVVCQCLTKAKADCRESIAIPAISAGLFGMPTDVVAYAICKALQDFNKGGCGKLKEIHLVNLEERKSMIIAQALNEIATSTKELIVDKIQGINLDTHDNCPICQSDIKHKKVLDKCKHSFCSKCIEKAFDIDMVCPVCKTRYGIQKGTQPRDGQMINARVSQSLPGYHCGTIEIEYFFPSGTQGKEHPNPGVPYPNTQRKAYLPDNTEGNEIYKLLKRAFDARLTFRIGRSSTTGKDNVIVWNDIHHKTNPNGGGHGFGYPDETYFQRVRQELADKGIK